MSRVFLAIDLLFLFMAVLSQSLAEDSLCGALYHSHADYWSHALCLSSLSISEAQACLVTGLARFISMTAVICFSLARILANILLPLPVCMNRSGGYTLQIHKPSNVENVSLFHI